MTQHGRRMRICFLAPRFLEHSARWALELKKSHDVRLIVYDDNAERYTSAAFRRTIASELPTTRLYHGTGWRRALLYPLNVAKIVWTCLVFRPDVVHVQEIGSTFVRRALQAVHRLAPIVLSVHDPKPHAGFGRTAYARARKAFEYGRSVADAIVLHSQAMFEEFRRDNPALADRCFRVQLGFYDLGVTSEEERRRPADPQFLFFGNIEPYKGLKTILAAVRILEARGRDFRVVVAGRGTDLDDKADVLAGNPRFVVHNRFIGVDELPWLLRDSRAVLLPYDNASQSGVAAMAFANGRPVIASRVGGLTEVVEDGVNGFLIPPGDAAALADAMEKFIDGSTDWPAMVERAFATARGLLGYATVAAESLPAFAFAIARRAAHK